MTDSTGNRIDLQDNSTNKQPNMSDKEEQADQQSQEEQPQEQAQSKESGGSEYIASYCIRLC